MNTINVILECILTVAGILVCKCLVPYIKSKYTTEQIKTALEWIEIAVKSAEQVYDKADGQKKKQFVLNFLTAKGIYIDGEELDNAIEATVYQIHTTVTENVNA